MGDDNGDDVHQNVDEPSLITRETTDPSPKLSSSQSCQDRKDERNNDFASCSKKKKKKKKNKNPLSDDVATTLDDENLCESEDHQQSNVSPTAAGDSEQQHLGEGSYLEGVSTLPSGENVNAEGGGALTKKKKKKKKRKGTENVDPVLSQSNDLVDDSNNSDPTITGAGVDAAVSISAAKQESEISNKKEDHEDVKSKTEEAVLEVQSEETSLERTSVIQQGAASNQNEVDYPDTNIPGDLNVQPDSPAKKKKKKKKKKKQETELNTQSPDVVLGTGAEEGNEMASESPVLEDPTQQKIEKERGVGFVVVPPQEKIRASDTMSEMPQDKRGNVIVASSESCKKASPTSMYRDGLDVGAMCDDEDMLAGREE